MKRSLCLTRWKLDGLVKYRQYVSYRKAALDTLHGWFQSSLYFARNWMNTVGQTKPAVIAVKADSNFGN